MTKFTQLALSGLIIFPAVLFAVPAFSIPANLTRTPMNLRPVKDWRKTIKVDTIQIADAIQFKIRDYIKETSFKKNPSVKAAFSPRFQQNCLKRPVQYSEDKGVEKYNFATQFHYPMILKTAFFSFVQTSSIHSTFSAIFWTLCVKLIIK